MHDPLPSGWEARNTASGKIYFVHHPTQSSTWTDPRPQSNTTSTKQNINAKDEHGALLPPHWERRVVPAGRSYYINHKTRSTTWLSPSASDSINNNARTHGTGNESDTSALDKDTKKLRDALCSAILLEKPTVKWDDIAGLEGAKVSLKEAVIFPTKFPHLFKGKRQPWKGILLYGPSGTGKSYIAKAVATESNSTFFSISASDLLSKWQGESPRLVKQLFEMAREQKPAVIFIDEIDSVARQRTGSEFQSEGTTQVLTELLLQMDGVGHDDKGVLVLAATNHPWQLDQAIKRRLEKRIYIPLPDMEARRQMFQLHIGTTPCTLGPEDFRTLASRTEGYSGSDIATVVKDALMQPMHKVATATHFKWIVGITMGGYQLTPCSPSDQGAVKKTWEGVQGDELLEPPLTIFDFLRSLDAIKPTVSEADVNRHEEWTKEYGTDGAKSPLDLIPPQFAL